MPVIQDRKSSAEAAAASPAAGAAFFGFIYWNDSRAREKDLVRIARSVRAAPPAAATHPADTGERIHTHIREKKKKKKKKEKKKKRGREREREERERGREEDSSTDSEA